MIWVGDLNVAIADIDLCHPTVYRKATKVEKGAKLDPKNVDQPGCTDAEREHFRKLLTQVHPLMCNIWHVRLCESL